MSSMTVRPGQHLLPAQLQQFVAGAALTGLQRTGQSARHVTYLSPRARVP